MRRPLVAFLLSILQPGVGQLYNAQPRKAAPLIILPILLVLVLSFVPVAIPQTAAICAWLGLLLYPALYVGAAWEAAHTARKTRSFFFKKYNHVVVYLTLIFVPFAIQGYITQKLRLHFLEPYVVPTESMAPTVLAGDRFYAAKGVKPESLRRGEILLFRSPRDREVLMVKRLIGLPGDSVALRGDELILNGKDVPREPNRIPLMGVSTDFMKSHRFLRETIEGRAYTISLKETTNRENFELRVGPAEVFFLGDNRDNSHDSRYFGTIAISEIVARPLQVWLSIRPGTFELRFSRMGIDLTDN